MADEFGNQPKKKSGAPPCEICGDVSEPVLDSATRGLGGYVHPDLQALLKRKLCQSCRQEEWNKRP